MAPRTPARGPRRKRRSEEVIQAAAEIFHRQGYADTTVEQIAGALGILKGSLYHYIDSKEDLLFRVLEQVHEDVGVVMDDVVGRDDLPPLGRLHLYVREQVAYNARNIKRISVYYQDRQYLSDDRRQMIDRRRRRHEKLLVGLVEEAQEHGDVPADLNPRLAVACVFATIIWVYTWYRPGGPTSPEELGAFCADFAVRGLTGSPSARAEPLST